MESERGGGVADRGAARQDAPATVSPDPGAGAGDLPGGPVPPAADLLDGDQLALLQRGDQAAWHQLISREEGRMYGYLYRLEGNQDEAMDLTQEVFYRAWKGIGTFRAGERLLPWLYQIARNTRTERYRRKQLSRFSLEEAQEDLNFEVVSERLTPLQQAESLDAQGQVQRALSRLTPDAREAVVLRFVEDLPYEDIARIQGVALGTAKSRVFRAKEQLGALLSPTLLEGLGEPD